MRVREVWVVTRVLGLVRGDRMRRNERVGVERKNGEGVCGAEERKTVRGYRREECGTEGGRGQ